MSQGHSEFATALLADWKARAACAGYANTYFFPTTETSPDIVARARAICDTCPVQAECLEYAFETNQISGIWGGTTEEERRSLRRRWLTERRRLAR